MTVRLIALLCWALCIKAQGVEFNQVLRLSTTHQATALIKPQIVSMLSGFNLPSSEKSPSIGITWLNTPKHDQFSDSLSRIPIVYKVNREGKVIDAAIVSSSAPLAPNQVNLSVAHDKFLLISSQQPGFALTVINLSNLSQQSYKPEDLSPQPIFQGSFYCSQIACDEVKASTISSKYYRDPADIVSPPIKYLTSNLVQIIAGETKARLNWSVENDLSPFRHGLSSRLQSAFADSSLNAAHEFVLIPWITHSHRVETLAFYSPGLKLLFTLHDSLKKRIRSIGASESADIQPEAKSPAFDHIDSAIAIASDRLYLTGIIDDIPTRAILTIDKASKTYRIEVLDQQPARGSHHLLTLYSSNLIRSFYADTLRLNNQPQATTVIQTHIKNLEYAETTKHYQPKAISVGPIPL